MTVTALVERCASSDRCRVHPPGGTPVVPPGLVLPPDLAEFYRHCGGVDLFVDGDYAISLVPPEDLQPSNVVIIGEQFPDDVSLTWFTVGRTPDSEYLSIDLSPERNGRCYDSYREIHGIVGSQPVIALSFTELFERLLDNGGRRWYWLADDFVPLGDAYD